MDFEILHRVSLFEQMLFVTRHNPCCCNRGARGAPHSLWEKSRFFHKKSPLEPNYGRLKAVRGDEGSI